MSFFTFSYFSFYWKVYFSSSAVSSVKSSSTDYNESNKPNSKSLDHIRSEKSFVKLGVPKNELFHFFLHFSFYWKVYFFTLNNGFLKRSHISKWQVLKLESRFTLGLKAAKIRIISKKALNKSYGELNFLQKFHWSPVTLSPRSGVKCLQRLPCLKYCDVLKRESRFSLGLSAVKNTDYSEKSIK